MDIIPKPEDVFTVEERWTKLLQRKLGDDYYVIEEGLSGRTTSFDDPVFEWIERIECDLPVHDDT